MNEVADIGRNEVDGECPEATSYVLLRGPLLESNGQIDHGPEFIGCRERQEPE